MKLPVIYPKELTKIVEILGFKEVRQKGSHKTLRHPDGRILTFAFHANKPVPVGLLNKIIKYEIKITREEFLKILK